MINDIICLNFPLNKTNNALSLALHLSRSLSTYILAIHVPSSHRLMVVNHNYAVRIAHIHAYRKVNLSHSLTRLDSYIVCRYVRTCC